jgi:hypothetical protein
MDGARSQRNEEGVQSFQTLDTLELDGSAVSSELEQGALAAMVTQVLVSRGRKRPDAERAVQGLGAKELWAVLRERQ